MNMMKKMKEKIIDMLFCSTLFCSVLEVLFADIVVDVKDILGVVGDEWPLAARGGGGQMKKRYALPEEKEEDYLTYEKLVSHYEEKINPGELVKVHHWVTNRLAYEKHIEFFDGFGTLRYEDPLLMDEDIHIPCPGPFTGMSGRIPNWYHDYLDENEEVFKEFYKENFLLYMGLEEYVTRKWNGEVKENCETEDVVLLRPRWLFGENVRLGWIHPGQFILLPNDGGGNSDDDDDEDDIIEGA